MGTLPIVRIAPAFDLAPSVVERQKDVLVETLLPQPGIETFNVGVLDRLTRRNKLEFHPMLVSPLIKDPAAQFRPIVRREAVMADE